MYVVLDTTETYDDPFLSGPAFTLLHSYLARHPSQLIISELVFKETVNHYREHLSKHLKNARRELGRIKKFVPEMSGLPELEIDIETTVAQYQEMLKSQIKHLGGHVIGFANVDTGSLVERALQRKKPFDTEGKKGFRDAILWETMLREIVGKNDKPAQIAFISANIKDFGTNGVLAEELRKECVSLGASPDCVKLFNGLQEFIDSEVKPHLDRLDAIEKELQNGSYKDFDPTEFFHDFADLIKDEVRDYVLKCDFERVTKSVPGVFHSQDLRSLDKQAPDVEVVDVWNVDGEQMAVGIDFTVEAEIEYVEQWEGYWPEGDEVFGDVFHEQYVGDATFIISMTVMLKQCSGEVDDWEVNDVEITLGTKWPTHNQGD